VERMSLAAVAAGSDGIMIEVHPDPKEALCDREQLLTLSEFDGLAQKIRKMYRAMNDILAPSV
jgi:3-deoxy-7-phosphoheptulonate synthase